MTRRDIIIISVLVNAGLLAVLFVTAVKSDPDTLRLPADTQQVAVVEKPATTQSVEDIPAPLLDSESSSASSQPIDEVDHVLKEYLPDLPVETVALSQDSATQGRGAQEPDNEDSKTNAEEAVPSSGTIVEVTVKRGDALEKIARANQTTVDEIRKANDLKNDKLKIGQVLKVPVGTVKPKTKETAKSSAPKNNPEIASGDVVYYTIKSGDNLWKIAKQFNVKFEDLLKMNNLNEEKAKNLKAGDKIRVK